MNVNRLRCARAIFVKTTQMKRISIRKIQYTNFSNKALCYGVLTLNNSLIRYWKFLLALSDIKSVLAFGFAS